jgi:broad specificity phosphatase PhoE
MGNFDRIDRATVFLLRHGRTALNAAGALRGRVDTPLDEVGRQEAARLAELFADSGLVLVVASPLRRATGTAAALAARCSTTVLADNSLADRDYGPWNGASLIDVSERFGSIEEAPGVEPWLDLRERTLNAVFAAVKLARGQPVAIVAHEAVNLAVLGGLLPTLTHARIPHQPTGCWNEVRLGAGSWVAVVMGATPGDGLVPGG